jgi:hypothetical protein
MNSPSPTLNSSRATQMRDAYNRVQKAYQDALAAATCESEAASIKKNMELAVVGMRDKLGALEESAAQ